MSSDPRQAVTAFMEAWKTGDIEAALPVVQKTYVFMTARTLERWKRKRQNKRNHEKPPMTIEQKLERFFTSRVLEYELIQIRPGDGLGSGLLVDAYLDTRLNLSGREEPFDVKVRMRLVCETGPYTPRADGDWGVNLASVSFLNRKEATR